MKRFLLDTNVLIYLLTDSPRLNDSIKNDIEYYQNDYAISIETIKEIITLRQIGKLKLSITIEQLLNLLYKLKILILSIELDTLLTLDKLPMFAENHDPADRTIISEAIARKRTLISSDKKFPIYRKCGLSLMEV